MTDLHAEIMNLPVNRDAMAEMDINMRVAYKEGHRDARHAAAELAVRHSASLADAQAEIARLRGALKVCQQALAKIHEAESETFDDELQENVQVAMDDEEMIEIARQALESTL